MTRDEQRNLCIKAIGITLFGEQRWEELGQYYITTATAVFDSLHGLARVDPIDATDEMLMVGTNNIKSADWVSALWLAMSAVGDLTNAPEKKT